MLLLRYILIEASKKAKYANKKLFIYNKNKKLKNLEEAKQIYYLLPDGILW